jgi:DNA-binding NarL/FixJ family response regulator
MKEVNSRRAASLRKDAEQIDGENTAWQGSAPVRRIHPEASTIKLTPRELQVLNLLCQGLSNKAIGRRLDIAVATVKGHVGRILRTLDVSTRLEAVLLARCGALVPEPSAMVQRMRPVPRRRPR